LIFWVYFWLHFDYLTFARGRMIPENFLMASTIISRPTTSTVTTMLVPTIQHRMPS
ncbi:MAG: hypothetical protein ACI96P_000290, partial [Candidatus Azotimanducaceae bacterium]